MHHASDYGFSIAGMLPVATDADDEESVTLEQRVRRSLENAAFENGYEQLLDWPAEQVVANLLCYDADLENEPVATLLPIVESWLQAQRKP